MKRRVGLKLIVATAVTVTCSYSTVLHAGNPTVSDNKIKEVSFNKVKVNDPFWAPRIEINRTVSIPSAFRECEKNGRFDNFALAAGLIKGEHKGDFSFDDTDPYKIIEGASYALASQYDPKLDAYLDSVINLIALAQEPDGYLTTCVTNKCERLSGWWGKSRWEKINSHELYNSGHLYEAAVAHYLATGKRSLLDVAIKNADLVCEVFGPGDNQKHVPSGHPIIEMALCKLYKVTGDKKYLDMALYFVEETGRGTDGHRLNAYSQDHKPILEQEEIVGHAVRAGYLYSGVADVAALTDNPEYAEAIKRIWNNMATKKLYITGGIGSRAQGEGFGPEYELNNHTAYCETCAAIANVYWNYRMFLATGNADYVDVYERALYNGVPSGVSLSGDRFFYDNPLQSMGDHERAPWFGCACCPGNVTRFVASVPGYIYATQGDDLFVNLYISSSTHADLKTTGITAVTQESQMPWGGKTVINIDPEKKGNMRVKLRIPSWTRRQPVAGGLYAFTDDADNEILVTVNGKKVDAVIENGYLTIDRKWKKGDQIEMELPMYPRMIEARPEVIDDRGRRALQYGPVVYCFEQPDNDTEFLFNAYLPEDSQISYKFDENLLGGVGTLECEGFAKTDKGSEKKHLKAIPYCVWNNRGPAQMLVWIPENVETATIQPKPTLASRSKMYVEPTLASEDTPAATSNLQWGYGYNDQWEPTSSSDTSRPYHYWWLRKGTTENICYEFPEPSEVSSVQVYWLDFDHYDGNFRVPESWRLMYKDDKGYWREVTARNEYGTDKDRYNQLSFDPVITTALKIEARLQPGESGGVIEWKVE